MGPRPRAELKPLTVFVEGKRSGWGNLYGTLKAPRPLDTAALLLGFIATSVDRHFAKFFVPEPQLRAHQTGGLIARSCVENHSRR